MSIETQRGAGQLEKVLRGGEGVAEEGHRVGDVGQVQAARIFDRGRQKLVLGGEGKGKLNANLRFSW